MAWELASAGELLIHPGKPICNGLIAAMTGRHPPQAMRTRTAHLDPETTLGPVVRTAAAEAVRAQVREAVSQGAKPLIEEAAFASAAAGTPYLAPQVLIGVDHSMSIMREETFGPAVAIIKVDSDEEAVHFMNDSEFGLSAVAIFSADSQRAEKLADALDTGTVFLNRCDDGMKGAGCDYTLSSVGFEHLTRPKSYHFGTTLEQRTARL